MKTIGRWYLFLVCSISLQAVTWAIITLLRGLLIPGVGVENDLFSFQIAVIIIGLPIFIVHWRKVGQDQDAHIQKGHTGGWFPANIYLYGMLAGFIVPATVNLFHLVFNLLQLSVLKPDLPSMHGLSTTDSVFHSLIAIGVLSLLATYFRSILPGFTALSPETQYGARVRRMYLLALSGAGLSVTFFGVVNLLHWVLFRLQHNTAIYAFEDIGLANQTARLVVGLPLWVLPWRRSQTLFLAATQMERESPIRKLYLYMIVFFATLATVINAALILTGFLRRILGPDPQDRGEIRGDIYLTLAILVSAGVIWYYHARTLRNDERLSETAPLQASIRRLYLYLVASIGLAAVLVGLGSNISVLIQIVSGHSIGEALLDNLAWATAILLSGLPVWLLPWRLAQRSALVTSPSGSWERRSLTRRIYLYLFLFLSTMTILASAVFLLSRLLNLLFGDGDTDGLLNSLAHSIAFIIIAVGVWIYHGATLRSDRRHHNSAQADRLTNFRLVVVDDGDGTIGKAILDGLHTAIPGATLHPIGLTNKAATVMGNTSNQYQIEHLADANLIIGPWTINTAASKIASAVSDSPAQKLMLPLRHDGWEWAGVERWDEQAAIQHAVRATQQIIAGESVKPARQLSIGGFVAMTIGILVILTMLVIPMMAMLDRMN